MGSRSTNERTRFNPFPKEAYMEEKNRAITCLYFETFPKKAYTEEKRLRTARRGCPGRLREEAPIEEEAFIREAFRKCAKAPFSSSPPARK